jgi:hypothetical protein
MLRCMRTTVTLPDSLLVQAKKRASQEGITLSDLVVAAVRDRMLRPSQSPNLGKFRLVEYGQGGLRSGLSWGQLKHEADGEDAARVNAGPAVRAADGE